MTPALLAPTEFVLVMLGTASHDLNEKKITTMQANGLCMGLSHIMAR